MKQLTKYMLYAAATLFFAAGCSLKEVSYTKPEVDGYMTDASKAESVLFGVYASLGDEAVYGLNLSMVFALPTDEAKSEGNSIVGTRQQCSNAFSTSDSYVKDTWASLYRGIFRANDFMENLETAKASFGSADAKLAEVYLAEAKCIRALLYFELVRWFGHVPLMKTTAESSKHPSTFKQEDPEKVYEFIEKDLLEAKDVLPYAREDNIRANNSYRFSKGAVLGLLARVYAQWAGYPVMDTSKWEDCKDAAEELINSDSHHLLADYDQLWRNAGSNIWNPSESLIEISYYSPASTNVSSGHVGKFNGVKSDQGAIKANYNIGLYKVHPTFIANWPDRYGDLRWAISFADYSYKTSGKTYYASATIGGKSVQISMEMAMDEEQEDWKIDWRRAYNYSLSPRKWDTEVYVPDENQLADANLSNINWYVLRYADVLLLYAEAVNELRHEPSDEAYHAVNMIRRRAYGIDMEEVSDEADLRPGMGYEEFRDAVRAERAYELAFEGQRRMDLTRWGIYADRIMEVFNELQSWHEQAVEYFPASQYTRKNRSELLPIPQTECDLCGYVQNPGWN